MLQSVWKLKDRISVKRMAVSAAVLFVLSVIPMIWLGKYNIMCVDDYNYGSRIYHAYTQTGSVLAAVAESIAQTKDIFFTWQGTYSSCFLMGMCPMNFQYGAAVFVPLLMIGTFAGAVYVFGKQVLCKWFSCEKESANLLLILLLFLFYQVMEAPFEGIYWYNGALHYVFMQALLFFMLAALSVSYHSDSVAKEWIFGILAALLSVVVAGGNLVTALQAEILTVFLIAGGILTKKLKKVRTAILCFFTLSAGFLCNVLAPGNAIRSTLVQEPGKGAVLSVLLSFYYSISFAIKWTNLMVILVWLALLPVMWRMAKKASYSFQHPGLFVGFFYCVYSAMFTPTLYALGQIGVRRVDNIIQMVYYLGLFLSTVYVFGYFSHRSGEDTAIKQGEERVADRLGHFLTGAGEKMTFVCMLLVLGVWILTADKNTYTSISASRSLLNGEAKTFYEQSLERHRLYTDSSLVEVEVQPYEEIPYLFAIEDLSVDSGDWKNIAVAEYYQKIRVKLAED